MMSKSTGLILKKIAGVALIIFGLVALLTPFTPGSWLIFIGAEMLGLRILFKEKLRGLYKRRKKKIE